MIWLILIAAWFGGALLTYLVVCLFGDFLLPHANPDEAAYWCCPFLPFWPLIAIGCLCGLLLLPWFWLTD